MKLNAVGVSSKDFKKSIEFYSLLGFEFPESKGDDQHIESTSGGTKLMIDSHSLMKELLGEEPKPGNHSIFAIEYDFPDDVNAVAKKISDAGFTIIKSPWDAFWGQRYAVLQDPDGYKVDLYASLS